MIEGSIPSEPTKNPPVTVFSEADLTELKTEGITTFPAGTSGVIEVMIPNPIITEPNETDPRYLPGGEDIIRVTLGTAQIPEPLRGTSQAMHVVTQPGEPYDLRGFKVATTDSPDNSPEAEALGPTDPTALLTSLFGQSALEALNKGVPGALRLRGFKGSTDGLPQAQLSDIKNVSFLVGGPKFSSK